MGNINFRFMGKRVTIENNGDNYKIIVRTKDSLMVKNIMAESMAGAMYFSQLKIGGRG